jgi:hypothetical protein
VKNTLIAIIALIGAFGAGWLLRPSPPQLDPHPVRTDTLYYPLVEFERLQDLIFEKGDDVVFTDTLPYPVVVERIVTDTQYVGWELPWTWGVDRLTPPVRAGDSMNVSLHGIKVDSLLGVQRTARMERIWTPGYLSYLEVDETGALRLDFVPYENEKKGSTVLRWIERGALVAFGALVF